MSDDGANREDDEKWILIDEKMCRTCKKCNIPKILYCGHVIWICEKCLSEKYEENSDQICCPQCQGPLVDPLLLSNGGGKILQENLFTDLFQDEEFYNAFIFLENNSWCSLPHPENIPSVSFCRLCVAMLCEICSQSHSTYHLVQYRESIRKCLVQRNSTLCCIHGTDSTNFCSTHSVPICPQCKKDFHKKCIVKDMLEVRDERMQTLLSKYSSLEATESILRKEQQSAEKRLQEDNKRINDETEQLVRSIRNRQKELKKSLEEKYTKKKEVLDRKLSRVIEHKSLVKHAMTSAPTPAFFDMTPTLQVTCDNVVSDTSVPDDVTLELCQDDISNVIETIKRLGKLIEPHQEDVLYFDNKYGQNIQLSENNKRARRLQDSENGIVLSSRPMEYDKLYQVEVLEYDAGLKRTMRIGVYWKDAELALPILPKKLKSSAIIGACNIWKVGEKVGTPCEYGKKLNDVRERSVVGIAMRSLDCRVQLHLYIDEVDCGPSQFIFPKEHNNLPHAVFDVRGKVKKIRALPLKKVSRYSPTLPCGITRCKTCEQISSACSISGPRGGLNLTSTGFSCHSKNVVYVVTCNKCNMLYVGETGGTIRKRCNSHRTNIESSVCEHVSKCGSKFSIAGVFKVKQDEDEQDGQNEEDEQKLEYENQRKAMETILILKLGTLQPSGLNKEK